jgi:hypothetical protein
LKLTKREMDDEEDYKKIKRCGDDTYMPCKIRVIADGRHN